MTSQATSYRGTPVVPMAITMKAIATVLSMDIADVP